MLYGNWINLSNILILDIYYKGATHIMGKPILNRGRYLWYHSVLEKKKFLANSQKQNCHLIRNYSQVFGIKLWCQLPCHVELLLKYIQSFSYYMLFIIDFWSLIRHSIHTIMILKQLKFLPCFPISNLVERLHDAYH